MLRRLLTQPRADRWILLLGVLLVLPALSLGFMNDDLVHQAHLEGRWPGPQRHPIWSLFDFVTDDPAARRTLDDGGVLPWWAAPDLHIAFLRPLSSATHWLDHLLWPKIAWAQHAHSLLWWALCLVGARALLRALHGPGGVAALALLLFAVDDAHLLPVGWLANRNAIVALALGLPTFYAWTRWREGRDPAWAALSAAGLMATLLAGESGVGAVAWMLAWQLTMAEGRLRDRLAPLALPAVIVVIWRVIYQFYGYGAHGSGLYIDPGHDPLTFLGAVATRLPQLGLTLVTGAPVEVGMMAPPPIGAALTGAGLLVSALTLRALWPLLREDRLARFHALGALGALLPACATFPMSRLLCFAGLNFMALLAMMAARAGWLEAREAPARARGLGLLLVLNGPLAALALFFSLLGAPEKVGQLQGLVYGHRAGRVGPALLVQVNGEAMLTPYMMLGVVAPEEAPQRVAVLSAWSQPVTVTRLDERTLEVEVEGGFLAVPKEQLMRSLAEPFHVGDRIVRPDYSSEVRAVLPDGQPRVVRFTFERPLTDPSIEVEAWTGDAFAPLTLEIGERRRLPSALGRT